MRNTAGENMKRIVFTESEHKHAQLIVKLKMDGMTQAKFFRQLITGYLEDDERVRGYVIDHSDLSLKKKAKTRHLIKKGESTVSELNLDNEQVEDIFDLIAEEFPDL